MHLCVVVNIAHLTKEIRKCGFVSLYVLDQSIFVELSSKDLISSPFKLENQSMEWYCQTEPKTSVEKVLFYLKCCF